MKVKGHVQRTAIVWTDFVAAQETARKTFPQHPPIGNFGWIVVTVIPIFVINWFIQVIKNIFKLNVYNFISFLIEPDPSQGSGCNGKGNWWERWGCCRKNGPCKEGEGSCRTDNDCADGLTCGRRNCRKHFSNSETRWMWWDNCCLGKYKRFLNILIWRRLSKKTIWSI